MEFETPLIQFFIHLQINTSHVTPSLAKNMPTTEELLVAITRMNELASLEEDEAEPYKHKYEAADLLKKVLGERALWSQDPTANADTGNTAADSGAPHPPSQLTTAEPLNLLDSDNSARSAAPQHHSSDADVAAAAARVRCGLILLDTDLLTDGEASIKSGLPLLEQSPSPFLAWLMEAYNALGALYSQRGALQDALSWLQRAESLYQTTTGAVPRTAHLPLPQRLTMRDGQPSSPPQETDSDPAPTVAPNPPSDATMAPVTTPAEAPESESELIPAEGAKEANVQGTVEEEGGEGAGSTAPVEIATNGDAVQCAGGGGAPAAEEQGAEGGGSGEGEGAGAKREGEAGSTSVRSTGTAAAAEATEEEGGDAASCTTTQSIANQLPYNDDDAVQARYTSTLYYLAQVHGHLKAADRSALYCAATLYRQLTSGKYDLDTWVNNCLQLGGYYVKVNAYALAMYSHAGAQAVVDRDTAAGADLGEDIAANIKLATARVYGARLATSHARFVEGRQTELHYPDVSYFPDYLRFSGLGLPSPDTFPWGEAALAPTFEPARDLLNNAMPYFKAALSYYQLDGWVTDHVGILMDMSNMYRCLAGFESDPGRAAAMHRCRLTLLEPLSGALNPDHYPGLSRSIDLELANVWGEVSDVRERQGGQGGKVATAAASAARYYQRFLRSFAAPDTGALPDRVDPDNEPYFLSASFGLGRMMQRVQGLGGPRGQGLGARQVGAAGGDSSYLSLLAAAQKHIQWTVDYVKRHELESWMREAQAAEELAELVVEHMRLRARLAARGGG